MRQGTLRTYIYTLRVDLYERVIELKEKREHDVLTEEETIELIRAEAQLEVVKNVVDICEKRKNKY